MYRDRVVDGDERQQLVNDHMMLVHSICRKIHARVGRCVEYDDLVGFGTTGLLEAADRFDPTVGVAFGTFAYYRVRGAVYDGMRTMGHLPRTEYEKIKAARRADELLERMGRQEAAARQPGRPTAAPSRADDLRAMYEAMADVVTVFVTSLDACIEQGAEFPDLGATPQDALGLRQLRAQLARAIAALPERERQLLRKHYYEDMTLRDAGAELGLSPSWASRLHARAVQRLHVQLIAQHAV